jgi:hypothetical protein
MRQNSCFNRAAAALVILYFSLVAIASQPTQSAFGGTVTDASGAPVRRVTIKIERLDQKAGEVVVQAEQGKDTVPPLSDGEYSLEATAAGFLRVKYYPIIVTFPNVFNFDVSMRVGATLEGGIGRDDPYRRVYGVLRKQDRVLASATVCLLGNGHQYCSTTNALGQYFLQVLAGSYAVEVEANGAVIFASRLDLSARDEYKNRLQLR